MPNRIDINCDMGESFGVYKLGRDAEVMDYISSANIACGWHAGDPLVMEQTVRLAKEKGVETDGRTGLEKLVSENSDAAYFSGKLASVRYFVSTVLSQAATKAQVKRDG